jgi:hypothetical protein
MPLPQLELKPGFDTATRSGKGHDDPLALLEELHEGVREVGVGAVVYVKDEPSRQPPTIGFELHRIKGDLDQWWEFFIEVPKFKATKEKLPAGLWGAFLTTGGRAAIARLMAEGTPPGELEAKLSSV